MMTRFTFNLNTAMTEHSTIFHINRQHRQGQAAPFTHVMFQHREFSSRTYIQRKNGMA